MVLSVHGIILPRVSVDRLAGVKNHQGDRFIFGSAVYACIGALSIISVKEGNIPCWISGVRVSGPF